MEIGELRLGRVWHLSYLIPNILRPIIFIVLIKIVRLSLLNLWSIFLQFTWRENVSKGV